MSKLGSGSLSPAAAVSALAVEATSSYWAPHGAVLMACAVGINVLVIFLIFFFFWRFFSGKRPGPSASAGAIAGDDDDDDASSSDSLPVASPWAARRRREDDLGAKPLVDVTSALPVYVYSAGARADDGDKAPECAVCIVELRDGDSARLLPRCGHRFHADCVGAWLRLHTTCPICRASVVVAPAPAAIIDESGNKDLDGATTCPV